MKTLAKLVVLLILLGVCLPAYGEIIIYSFTNTNSHYNNDSESGGDVGSETEKGYIILEVTYNEDGTIASIDNATRISYWKEGSDKWYEQMDIGELSLERIVYGSNDSKVRWMVYQEGDGSMLILTGRAYDKNIGAAENRKVATTLKGYNLWHDDLGDGSFEFGIEKITLTLKTTWTKHANDDEGLNQDFDAAVDYAIAYLDGKGYDEYVEEEGE
jgi:hypothetical protein